METALQNPHDLLKTKKVLEGCSKGIRVKENRRLVRTNRTPSDIRVPLTQLREQLRQLFQAKLCQTASRNSFAREAPRYSPL
jgi:hypothetical protein